MNTERSVPGDAGLVWFKSSRSGGDGGECVEVAVDAAVVRVRDSKDASGSWLAFTPAAWAAFVELVAERGQ